MKDAEGKPRLWPADGQFHTIRLDRIDDQKGIWGIQLDGENLPLPEAIEISALARQRGRPCTIAVHVDGDPGAPVELKIDRIEIQRLSAQ